jgi:hypothetical protein
MFERYIHEPLPAHLSHADQYVLPREMRILLQDLLNVKSGGEQTLHKGYPM